jgi:hypothetical protein
VILTNAQELAVIHAIRPLQGHERMAFMNALEALFAGSTELLGPLLQAYNFMDFGPKALNRPHLAGCLGLRFTGPGTWGYFFGKPTDAREGCPSAPPAEGPFFVD